MTPSNGPTPTISNSRKPPFTWRWSQHGKAVTLLDTLLDDNPNHEEILLNRAESHMALKQYDLAKEDFSTLQSFAPNDPRSYYRLAHIAKEQRPEWRRVDKLHPVFEIR